MSRVGKKPIEIPSGVEAKLETGKVTVKGPLGEMSQNVNPKLTIRKESNTLVVERPSNQKLYRELHGLTRNLIANMVNGVGVGLFGPFVTYFLYRRYGAGPQLIALLFSMIIAPVLSSVLFRNGVKEFHNPVLAFVTARYRGGVRLAIEHRYVTAGVGLLAVGASAWLAKP